MSSVCPKLAGFRRCNNYGKDGHFDSGTDPNSDSSPEPIEERRQHALGSRQSVCDDWDRGSRLR